MMYDELVKRLRNCATEAAPCLTCDMTDDGSCIETLMKQAADAIEELQQIAGHYEESAHDYFKDVCYYLERMPKWIPVTERLPEFEGAVLCMRKSNIYGVRPYQEILYVDEYGFKNFDDIYLTDGVVTHWMPLPQPPKEET